MSWNPGGAVGTCWSYYHDPWVWDDLLVSSCFNSIRTSSPMNLGIAMVASYVAALEGLGQGCWSHPGKKDTAEIRYMISYDLNSFTSKALDVWLIPHGMYISILILWILVAEWSLIQPRGPPKGCSLCSSGPETSEVDGSDAWLWSGETSWNDPKISWYLDARHFAYVIPCDIKLNDI